jgi:retron-type reverse transcriptase
MATGLERIGELLRTHPERRLDTLMHLVNRESLEQAHKDQSIGKAVGVDSMTKTGYSENLHENLDKLIQRMKTFSYKPRPVRRTYIPIK